LAGAERVLVLGAGSIGTRHARELHDAGAAVDIADPDAARANSSGAARPVPFDLDALDGYDGIVVASPTNFHQAQLGAALATEARVLVEKPLALRAVGLETLLALGKGRGMVGYNLRFHEPVRRFVNLVLDGTAGTVRSIRLWFGSWLPDWRPAVDYRTTYSARSALGGGVLLDAIHELDLLLWLAGDDRFTVTGAVVDRLGPLDVDVEDTVKALLRHDGGMVADLSLDYLSRRYRRGIEVVGDRATLRLDWARKVIEVEDATGVRVENATTTVDMSYRLQARCFLSFVRGQQDAPVDLELGAASLRLADRIRGGAG
jgi:predicted dehydrogenase